MDLMSFIPSQLGILIAALYVLGYALKITPKILDNYIPIILLIFSAIFSVLMMGLSPIAILQGILCWGVSVGINQTCKQYCKLKNKDKD